MSHGVVRDGRPVIVVDLDGVLAYEGDTLVYGDVAGWCYEKCLPVPGASKFLKKLRKKYFIIIQSARPADAMVVTRDWLAQHSMVYDDLSVGSKPRAALYVDDRAFHFYHSSFDASVLAQVVKRASENLGEEVSHGTV